MKAKLIFRFLIYLQISTLAANPPLRFSYISSSDGLANNFVHSICQDKNGFLWFGTNIGLSRYDGYSFLNYQPDPYNSNSLHGRAVHQILPDSHGNLWMSFSVGGLNRLDLKGNSFYFYEADTSKTHSLSGNWISRFIEDKNGDIWVATNQGIDKWNSRDDNFDHYYNPKKNKLPFAVGDFRGITYDRFNNIWFNSITGIGRINQKDKTIVSLGQIANKSELDQLPITAMLSDHLNSIWFCTPQNGLFQYNISQNKITNIIPKVKNLKNMFLAKSGQLFIYADNPEMSLFIFEKPLENPNLYTKIQLFEDKNASNFLKFAEDQFGNVWLGSRTGLFKYNNKEGLELFPTNQFLPNYLVYNNINAIFIDNQSNLWLSPYRRGINKADLLQKPFKVYDNNPSNPKMSLSGNNVTSALEDSKRQLWVGCFSDGLTRISPDRKTYSKIELKSILPFNVNDNVISTIFEDHLGYIWLGYYGNILDRLNPKTSEIDHFANNKPNSFVANGVRCIISDSSHHLWMASAHGLLEFDDRNQSFTNHSRLFDKAFFKQNSFFRYLCFDKKENIWICSQNGGLIYYDRKNKTFIHYLHDDKNKESIVSNTVYYVLPDSGETIWVGTSLGLSHFNPKNKKFIRVGEKQGLVRFGIYSILPGEKDDLWMSSDKGLIRYNTQTDYCAFFNQYDGLPPADFNTTCHFKSIDGNLYFGTAAGLVSFAPTQIQTNTNPSKPTLTSFSLFNKKLNAGDTINGRVVLKQQIWATSQISLNYNESDFQIEFSAIHFSAPQKLVYEYILEGYHSNWNTVDANHRWVSFTGLPPGKYTFKLRATNNDGVMCSSSNEATLHITITPPFWLSIWFKSMLAIFSIGLALLIFRIRTINLRKQKEQLEVKVKERTYELEEANVVLEERQEEINVQKEEIQAQYDTLEQTNKILVEQQEQIIKQNRELDCHRNNLEGLVEERTRDVEKALLKAEESDRLKSAFLANMSHEIRTPMNAILGFSSLLNQPDLPETDRQEFINIIHSNGNSLLVLINDILDLSRLQSEQMVLHPSEVNLDALLREIHDTFLLETQQKKIELKLSTLHLHPNLKIITDEVRLKQVLGNLIANAMKFTSEGSVSFGIKEVGDSYIFFVADTGIGISEEVGDNIFARFLKIEEPKIKLFGGTGLGLSICKQLVELWNGKIWYESKVNQGTTFMFTHPAKHCDLKPKIIKQKTMGIPSLNGKVILIAEDERFNFLLLEAYLAKTSASVIWVTNGLDALNFIKDNHVDLVLMDIKMPIMDGKEASLLIKAQYPYLPIIAQSAFAFQNEIEENIRSGIDICLSKPVKQEELFQTIAQILFK